MRASSPAARAPAVYDTMTSGFNATGTFSSATLDDSGTDTEKITLWGSGSGTVEAILPGSGSANHYAVSDSYYETETRVRSYALADNTYGSMTMYDDTSDSASGTGGFAGYSFSMAEGDMNNISESLSSAGVYEFNMNASGYGPGGSYIHLRDGQQQRCDKLPFSSTSGVGTSPTGTYGSIQYSYIGSPGTFNSYTSGTIQRLGGQYTIDRSAVTNLIDGSDETWDTNRGAASRKASTEAYGVSDPIATTNNLNGSSYHEQSGFIQMEMPLDTIQQLAFYDAQYGRTTSLYIMSHDVSGSGTDPYNPYTDESELASPTNASGLSSQAIDFPPAVKTDLAEGGVETCGGNNTTTSEGQIRRSWSDHSVQRGLRVQDPHLLRSWLLLDRVLPDGLIRRANMCGQTPSTSKPRTGPRHARLRAGVRIGPGRARNEPHRRPPADNRRGAVRGLAGRRGGRRRHPPCNLTWMRRARGHGSAAVREDSRTDSNPTRPLELVGPWTLRTDASFSQHMLAISTTPIPPPWRAAP